MTSDGGLDLDAVDKLVPLLADHVDIVGPRALVTAALTGEGGGRTRKRSDLRAAARAALSDAIARDDAALPQTMLVALK